MKRALFGSDIEELQAAYDDFNSADKLKTYNAIADSGKGGGQDAAHLPRIRSNVSRVFNSPHVESGLMNGLADRFGMEYKQAPASTPPDPVSSDGQKAGSLGGWWHGADGIGSKAVDAVGEGVAKATDRLANASMGSEGKDLGKKLSTGDFGAIGKVMSGGGTQNPAEKNVADGMAQTLPESTMGNMKNPLLRTGLDMAAGKGVLGTLGSLASGALGAVGSLFGGGGGSDAQKPQLVENQRGGQMTFNQSGKLAAASALAAKLAANQDLMPAFTEAGRNWGKTIGEMAAPQAENMASKAVDQVVAPWASQTFGDWAGGALSRAARPDSDWSNWFNQGTDDEGIAKLDAKRDADANAQWTRDTEHIRQKNTPKPMAPDLSQMDYRVMLQ